MLSLPLLFFIHQRRLLYWKKCFLTMCFCRLWLDVVMIMFVPYAMFTSLLLRTCQCIV